MCGLKICMFGKRGKKGKKRERTIAIAAPQQEPESGTHVLVLIMLDCDGKAFNDFIAQLPKEGASHNQRYEQPGLNIRGYKTALEVQYARSLQKSQTGKDAGILGLAYFGQVLLDPPPFNLPFGLKSPRQTQPGQNVGLGDLWHLAAVDASPSHLAGRGVNVYVMDTGINKNHAEFQGRDFADSFVARDEKDYAHEVKDSNGHGTAVASLIGGNNVGVAKGVNIIPVKHLLPDNTLGLPNIPKSSPMSLFESLQWILWHVMKTQKQGRAVVNVSQGIRPCWTDGIQGPTEEEQTLSDPWFHFLKALSQQDIVVVTSAGHDGDSAEDAAKTQSPRRWACPGAIAEKTLVVIGGSQRSAGNPDALEFWPQSNSFSIVDVLAPGRDITVARHGYDGVWRRDSGTSLSAAITAGIIAQYLGENDIHTLNPGGVASIVKRAVGQLDVSGADAEKLQVTHEGRSFRLIRTF
ncbi:Subtilisin-like protease 6 [Cytospora mali]|uniref:Subtilisin-like protease 6 n=1 Tax=Cytospora mali TaxID=578113 RepID=A0A194UWF3_CYTMA|nr:Subtilisin-like protease 6 [Valsa mali var. pyri (nom. inval.)]